MKAPDKLILLNRINPTEYEIHRGEINLTRNLILTTKDKELAERIVNSYNKEFSTKTVAMDNIKVHNKLIGTFMGLEFPLTILKYGALICQDNGNYHKSWDWLMKVIEKIQYIEDNQEEYFGEEYFNIHFEIDFLNGVDLSIDGVRIFMQTAFDKGQLIEAVYGGVVTFIKWYNLQNGIQDEFMELKQIQNDKKI